MGGPLMSNVYEIVTQKVIEQLESGTAPWRRPWRAELPCNLVSGKEYRGLNVFLLGSRGYRSRYWVTFAQTNKLGGHVKKGEKSSTVIFWNVGREKIVRNADGVERKTKPSVSRII